MTVHVIGAGIAGLASAVTAASAHVDVVLHEATNHAGGRTRAFQDPLLGATIDNGNHLLVGSNLAARRYLCAIGTDNALQDIRPAAFPFVDLANGDRWCLQPGAAVLPLWLFSPNRRVKGCGPAEHLRQIFRLLAARNGDTVASAVGQDSPLFEKLWTPLSLAVLNTAPGEADATLLRAMVRQTFLRGEKGCRPMFFAHSLSETLVDPALDQLRSRGADIVFNSRIRKIAHHEGFVVALESDQQTYPIQPGDAVVLAVPPPSCNQLWPEAASPLEHHAIVNVHFRLDQPLQLPWNSPFLGLLGGRTHWLFLRGNILSATISAADDLATESSDAISGIVWNEASRALALPGDPIPPSRVIKERRATLSQTPAQVAERPGPMTSLRNLFLAGDWTDTGLPATIESSVRSGIHAANLALGCPRNESAPDRPLRDSQIC